MYNKFNDVYRFLELYVNLGHFYSKISFDKLCVYAANVLYHATQIKLIKCIAYTYTESFAAWFRLLSGLNIYINGKWLN